MCVRHTAKLITEVLSITRISSRWCKLARRPYSNRPALRRRTFDHLEPIDATFTRETTTRYTTSSRYNVKASLRRDKASPCEVRVRRAPERAVCVRRSATQRDTARHSATRCDTVPHSATTTQCDNATQCYAVPPHNAYTNAIAPSSSPDHPQLPNVVISFTRCWAAAAAAAAARGAARTASGGRWPRRPPCAACAGAGSSSRTCSRTGSSSYGTGCGTTV